MTTITGYLEQYGDLSLSELPFNEVDSLVLCQLSYLNFRNFVNGLKKDSVSVPVKDIFENPLKEHLLDDYWYKEDNMKLFTAFVNSKRFGETKLNFFSQVFKEEDDLQFAAVTYLLPDKSVYIAFRGTDATLIGWKEDVKLAYSEPVYAQVLAAEYVDFVAEYVAGDFRVGGHSKGGNLAVYALMYCKDENRKFITEVFDHDGPGFRPEVLAEGHFEAVKDRVHKYIPASSIVGIIMDDSMDYRVVESYARGAFQHNSHSWKCGKGEFIYDDGFSKAKKVHNEALNEWIYSLSDEEIDIFLGAVHSAFTEADSKSLYDLAKEPKKNLLSLYEKHKEMDEKSRQILSNMIKRFFEMTGSKTFEELEKIKEETLKVLQFNKKEKK